MNEDRLLEFSRRSSIEEMGTDRHAPPGRPYTKPRVDPTEINLNPRKPTAVEIYGNPKSNGCLAELIKSIFG